MKYLKEKLGCLGLFPVNNRCSFHVDELDQMLCAWQEQAAKLKAGEINQGVYDNWRYYTTRSLTPLRSVRRYPRSILVTYLQTIKVVILMSLERTVREKIQLYCTKDLPGDLDWHIHQFDFIDDAELKDRLGRAFYSARYISKLMEALYVTDNELHPFVKFQVMQYASIYEAVITYLLWNNFKDYKEVAELQTHKAYKPVSALGSQTSMEFDGEKLYTCVYKDEKTPKNSIPFGDKVDCAVKIGFVDARYAEDIKSIYTLRNLAHIETEAKKQIEIEIEHAKLGYWRMQPFLECITNFLADL